MSHFAQLKVVFQQRNETELIASLKTLYGQDGVEVHKDPKDLSTWTGARATEQTEETLHADPCHIIVRKETLAKRKGTEYTPFNDLGYRRMKDGGYTAYIDEAGVPKADISLIAQEYALKVSERQLRGRGYTQFQRVQLEDSSVRLEAGGKFIRT